MKILLVEDSAVYRSLIARHLKGWGFDFMTAADGFEGWNILRRPDAPRLALLDWVLPKVDGVELCQRIRRRSDDEPYIYTVVLTAKNEQQDLLQAMEAGADDYLVKPFDEFELKARLLAGKRILDLQDQLVSARDSLRFTAAHDALTGLWNRAEVVDFLRREMARGGREHRSVGVILVDVDHFKKVNDTLGHLAGDSVLKEVAHRLASSLRVYDGAGRFGGEEFLLVLPGCDLETIMRRADEIRAAIAAAPVKSSQTELKVTVSMGVAVVNGQAGVELETLLHQADTALYAAKNNGRNRVECQLDSQAAGVAAGAS